MVYGRRRLFRNLWGSLAVAVTIAVISLGLPALDRQIPSARQVSSVLPYQVGAGVSLVPPAGASIDVTKAQPGAHQGRVLFLVGPVRYAVTVTPFAGTLADAAKRIRTKITATAGFQVTGGEAPISTRHGVTGRQGVYATAGHGGRYAVFVADGQDVEVTIAGNDVDLRARLPQILESVRTISFGGRP